MKKRNPFFVFFMTLLTGFIYFLYWLASTRKVLQEKTGKKIPTIWLLVAPFVLLFGAIILLVILLPHTANGTQTVYVNEVATQQLNTASAGANIAILLVSFVAILLIVPIHFYWNWKYSKAVETYTNGSVSSIVAFAVLWLLGGIGAAIIQDKYNDIEDAGGVPTQAAPGMPAATPPASPAPPSVQPPAPAAIDVAPPSQPVEPSPNPDPVLPPTPVTPPTPTEPPTNPTPPSQPINL